MTQSKTFFNKKQKLRRFFLVLPLLVLPFLTLLFWSLGGGKNSNAIAQVSKKSGFNILLPDAKIESDSNLSKLDYYNRAQADSLKLAKLINNDPAYERMAFDEDFYKQDIEDTTANPHPQGLNTSLYNNNSAKEQQIYQNLSALETELNRPQPTASVYEDAYEATSYNNENTSADVVRLEEMMQSMQESDEPDEEMRALNGMLEKVLDIQHPDRVKERLEDHATQKKGRVYNVAQAEKLLPVSTLSINDSSVHEENGFYSLEANNASSRHQSAVQAVIHQTQVVTNGATVKMRLLNDIRINGVLIPKDHFVYGAAALDGERLHVKINGIRYQESLLPVELSVFDMDGISGIHIPGAISRDVAKESADRSFQDIGITAVDPSWGTQAASAGIEAAKTLFSRKVRLIKVTLKAGYRILLQDEKQKQE